MLTILLFIPNYLPFDGDWFDPLFEETQKAVLRKLFMPSLVKVARFFFLFFSFSRNAMLECKIVYIYIILLMLLSINAS